MYVALLGNGGTPDTFLSVGSASPTGDNQLASHSLPVINNSGASAYRASYSGAHPETGVYSRAPDGMESIHLLQGDDSPEGGLILSLGTSLTTFNEQGQIAVMASIVDEPFTRKGLLRLDGTIIHELARDGEALPGGTTVLNNIISNAAPLNDLGQTVFSATYTQPGVTTRGLFLADDSGISLLTSANLPGSGSAANYLRAIGLNNDGQTAFAAEFGGGVDPVGGIYLASAGGVQSIALEDTAAPVAGKFFRRLLNESIALNENGQVAFIAELSNSANGPLAGRGLFLYDPSGGLEQVVGVGDALSGSTIVHVGFTGSAYTMASTDVTQAPDANFSGLNDLGQLAFNFALANGVSGIGFWSDLGPVPGDYNSNGIVDAADYTTWRNHLGQSFVLANENPSAATPGVVDEEDYVFWKANFGAGGSGGGSAASVKSAPVPEPSPWILAALGCLALHAVRKRS
jgi:hypothetical protein